MCNILIALAAVCHASVLSKDQPTQIQHNTTTSEVSPWLTEHRSKSSVLKDPNLMISWKQPLGTYPQPAQPSEFGDHNYTYFWRGTLTKRRSRRERTTSTLAKGVSPVNHMAFLLNIDVTLYEAYVICSVCRWLWRASIFRDTVHNDPSQAHTNQCKVKEKPGQNSDRLLSNIVNGSFAHMWMSKPVNPTYNFQKNVSYLQWYLCHSRGSSSV